MAVPTFHENSGVEFTAEPEDWQGGAALPTTLHWKLSCDTTSKVLQDWTSLTTGTSVTIEIPGSLNKIQDRSNQRETKVLLVVADKDTDREYSEEFPYYVKRTARN